ncbi:hypothetical protein MMC14_002305 [Varicellaria rhodocarpa]|nr:hypothetical protein [Varicellaria rhodocarpa]
MHQFNSTSQLRGAPLSDNGSDNVWGVRLLLLLLFIISFPTASYLWSQAQLPRGCRRTGLKGSSNLADEFNNKYARGTPDQSKGNRWKVKSLWIFPVKSCRGVELDRGTVVETGLKYDRQFSFAQWKETRNKDTPDGQKGPLQWTFITQREFPLLARVRTELWIPDPSSYQYSETLPEVQSGGVMIIKFPRQDRGWKTLQARLDAKLLGQAWESSFSVPFNPTQDQIQKSGYTWASMKIWEDSPMALNMTCCMPYELKQFLGVKNPMGLFRVDTNHHRQVFRNAPRKEQLGYQPVVGFADAYPLHILNLASVHDLANRIENGPPKLSVGRFRSNIIVTGPLTFAEDHWKRVRIGDGLYDVSCRTARCKLPNTDQITGEKHTKEPDNTLRSYRKIDEGAGGAACLGMQMVPASENGTDIRVGDTIEVLEVGEHFYQKQ